MLRCLSYGARNRPESCSYEMTASGRLQSVTTGSYRPNAASGSYRPKPPQNSIQILIGA